jgi:hypothetical protein
MGDGDMEIIENVKKNNYNRSNSLSMQTASTTS